MAKKRVFLFLILIMALASFFRLWEIKSIPPGFSYDESMYANNAVEAWANTNFSAPGGPALGWKIFYPENNGREGLWINMLAPVLAIFGENEPWVSRTFAAIFGILTVLGLYFLTKALFKSERLALLSSFFMAVSFWHINFSRIGFRAILTPFFLVWSFYFLWTAYEKGKLEAKSKRGAIVAATIGGLLFGLGFHTYISFRVAPLLLIIPFILMWRNKQKKLILIFLFFTFIVALPIGLYFLENPQDFFGRSSQISIFASHPPTGGPALTFGFNIVKTVGMFFVWGDGNWRHNLSGAPELWWPVAILFLLGIIIGIKTLIRNFRPRADPPRAEKFKIQNSFILLWLVALLIPTVISSEGLPHALRSIGVIPAAMILAALGLEWLIVKISEWLRKKMGQYPEKCEQLLRIKRELFVLLIIFLLAVVSQTFNQYFFRWAPNPNVANAFDESYTLLGKYLNTLPRNIPKYVIINTESAGIGDNPHPPPAVMFITDSYVPANRIKNNIFYINPANLEELSREANQKEHFFITMLEFNSDINIFLRNKIPDLKIDASSGITVLYR